MPDAASSNRHDGGIADITGSACLCYCVRAIRVASHSLSLAVCLSEILSAACVWCAQASEGWLYESRLYLQEHVLDCF
jgi:hypothetical protein